MTGRLKLIGSPLKVITHVAVCGGAGGEYVLNAIEEKMDLYITADVKHHEAQWAKSRGLALIDGGHWGTEWHFSPVMSAYLKRQFGRDVEVMASNVSADPYR